MYRSITFSEIEILFFIKQGPLKSVSEWQSRNVGVKLLSDLVIFSIFFSDIPSDLHESIRVVPLKYLMCFSTGINTK